MANLKLDLLNKIKNDKYYEELELVRLAADPNMVYKNKIESMEFSLERIALLNAQLGLVEQYFQDAPPQTEVQPAPAPQGQPAEIAPKHQGQTHGE